MTPPPTQGRPSAVRKHQLRQQCPRDGLRAVSQFPARSFFGSRTPARAPHHTQRHVTVGSPFGTVSWTSFFFMTHDTLKSPGRGFCRMSFKLGLSSVCSWSKEVMDLGKNTTEVMCASCPILPGAACCLGRRWPRSRRVGSASFLHRKVPISPSCTLSGQRDSLRPAHFTTPRRAQAGRTCGHMSPRTTTRRPFRGELLRLCPHSASSELHPLTSAFVAGPGHGDSR